MAQPLLPDTTAEAEAVLIEMIRESPEWRRLQLAGQMSQTAREMSKAGLRTRFPDAAENELIRRFADLQLGETLARKVYGPPVGK